MKSEDSTPCDANEWYAETLMSRGRKAEAVRALEDAIDCNPGFSVLQDRVLQNAMRAKSHTFQRTVEDAAVRFQEAVAAQPNSDIANANLKKVLTFVTAVPSNEQTTNKDTKANLHDMNAAQEAMLDALMDEL